MLIGRISADGPDGPEVRIVVASNPIGPWFDVRTAERREMERRGATPRGARRLAAAIVPESTTAALENGDRFIEALRRAVEMSDEEAIVDQPTFVTPLDPSAYRDFMAFEKHFSFGYRWRGLEVPGVLYEFPVSYMGSVHGFLGPDDEVPWPHYTQHMDYELELGIVIGRRARDLTPESALDAIFGYTILNDFSARDIQLREMSGGLGPSKGKHFGSAVGPWIATSDVVPPAGLRMSSRVNGVPWCEANSSEMIWSIAELVAWASAGENLAIGTLLGSGTANGGSGVELDRRLQPGDVVELEIEGLGVLRNRIGSPRDGWMPVRRNPSQSS